MEQAEMKDKSITVSPGGVFHVDEEEKEEMKNIISKFPQEESWKVSVNLYKYQDFWDPKDVLVSQFHFTCKHGDAPVKPFHEVYDKFCNGVTDCGPFWDHVLGYWKASLEFPQKVLFLKYHDLQNDTAFHVKNIANFIGCPFSFNEKQKGMVEEIVRLCSFENLSSLDANNKNAGKVSDNSSFTLRYNAYFRKAKFGDWKNYLTPEMAERIDQITYEKFNDIGLHFL